MLTLPGFQFHDVIYEDPYILVCYAYSENTGNRTLLKLVKESNRTMIENAKIMNEYTIASGLQMEGILRPEQPIVHGHTMALQYQPINGVTLRRYYTTQFSSIDAFFTLAIRISKLLVELHESNVVHLNLRPDTILIQPETMRVYLSGFGYATSLTYGGRPRTQMTLLEACPPYMSPEQTGRMEHTVDHRADLYSLGVTFFEWLTGSLPYSAADALGWSHAHMAEDPRWSLLDTALPLRLQNILRRLLAKDPDVRYPQADALLTDLVFALEEVTTFRYEGQEGKTEQRSDHSFKAETSDQAAHIHEAASMEGETLQKLVPLPASSANAEPNSNYPHMLDLAAMVRSSQLFVKETSHRVMIQDMMKLVMLTAGADQAWFIMNPSHEPRVEWMKEVRQGRWTAEPVNVLLRTCPRSARRVVQECLRSQQMLRTSRKTKAVSLSDKHPSEGKVSMLALPLIKDGEVKGCLLLSNRFIAKAFIPERLSTLQQLASQALFIATYTGMPSGLTSSHQTAELLPHLIELTSREKAVLQWIAKGLTNKEIAEQMSITSETVKAHLKNIYRKLKVDRRIKAAAAAHALGLLEEGDHP
ncbi:protein kinase domain-containing protein [Marinicrinis lubricantis]|uniref:LuxR C-terminal-related transcriptional regulator n=1 Tax=Marinicrinis lubricantis TaxID=2086470 RepID=A0ABW1ILP8_9BACL